MTPEELAAKFAELEAKAAKVDELEKKNTELEARLPATPEAAAAAADLAYRPKTWKELQDNVDTKAEAAALKVLQESEKRKEEIAKKQDAEVKENEKKIDEAFKKLEEEGVIEKTERKDDVGGKQRAQILGSLVKSGGQFVDVEARKLKTAWEAGLEYDFESNSFKKAGSAPYAARNQEVASSAVRTPAPTPKGQIDMAGVRGDLDEAQRRWEIARGK